MDDDARKAAAAAAKAKAEAEAAARAALPPSALLTTLTSPPCELRLTREDSPRLFVQSTAAGNKTLPKRSVLLRVAEDLVLSTKPSNGPIFDVHADSQVFCKDAGKCATLRQRQ